MIVEITNDISVNSEHITYSKIEVFECTVRVEIHFIDGTMLVEHIKLSTNALALQNKANLKNELKQTKA